MEPAQRNLMIGYSVVCFLSLIGVSLNLVSVFNINSIDSAEMNKDLASGLRSGFYTNASVYLLLVTVSLFGIIKKNYSKKGLIALVLLLLATFVFGHYIFDFYVQRESL